MGRVLGSRGGRHSSRAQPVPPISWRPSSSSSGAGCHLASSSRSSGLCPLSVPRTGQRRPASWVPEPTQAEPVPPELRLTVSFVVRLPKISESCSLPGFRHLRVFPALGSFPSLSPLLLFPLEQLLLRLPLLRRCRFLIPFFRPHQLFLKRKKLSAF